jgi:oxygen-dependent protoporphyrinogen oxidase
MPGRMRVIVVGGGISGLAATSLLRAAGHDAVCVEAAHRPGGLVQTERVAGFLCEAGPQAVLDDAPDTMSLIAALGLEARALRGADAARRRFVFARGRLRALPASPPALLGSGLLSPLGKLRLFAEPLVPRRRAARGTGGTGGAGGAPAPDLPDPSDSETVAAFGARRLGHEAGRLLATAAIGIYAADAGELSLASAFPRLAAMEREHGSLLKGALAGRKRGRRPGRPVSFVDGMSELPAALVRALGPHLVRGRAAAIEPRGGAAVGGAGTSGRWRVVLDGGPAAALDGDGVVLAADPAGAAALLSPLAPEAAALLRGVAMTPIAVCCLGFRPPQISALGMDLGGYGFLVGRGEGPRLLGCQYESSVFAGRAPEGGVLLRALLGGRGPGFEPEIVEQADDAIAARAVADLRATAGLAHDPEMVRVWRHPRGIPLYAPGHARRIQEIDGALRLHAGLHLVGQAVRGVGVNEGIRAAALLARALTTG